MKAKVAVTVQAEEVAVAVQAEEVQSLFWSKLSAHSFYDRLPFPTYRILKVETIKRNLEGRSLWAE